MFRCELCDGYLPIFSLGRLCESCYRIRTITKCYNSKVIRSYLEAVFLVEEECDDVEHASNKRLASEVRDEIETRSKKKYSEVVKK